MNKILTAILTAAMFASFSVFAFADVVWTPMDTVREFALPVLLVAAVVGVTVILLIKFFRKKK
ncbi:MAG: hypothetical protein IKB13_10510 [Clostridia bacterium]|nr:hypothetical protein [Clostridia bacterium]